MCADTVLASFNSKMDICYYGNIVSGVFFFNINFLNFLDLVRC